MDQTVHKQIDYSRLCLIVIRLNLIQIIADFLSALQLHYNRMGRVTVNLHHSFCSVENRGVVFRSIAGPACSHGSDASVFHLIDTDGIVIHSDETARGISFIQRTQITNYLRHSGTRQILDQIGFMDSKVCHGPHDRFLLIEKPDIPSRVNAPGLRTAMGKICLVCDNVSNQSAFYQFSGLSMGFCKPLVVAYHQKTPCFL